MNTSGFRAAAVFILAMLWLKSVAAQDIYTFKPAKVTDNVYLLESTDKDGFWVSGNVIVIINDDDVFVVDSGLLPAVGELAVAEIKKLTSKPVRYLMNTHWHGDHWQGNIAFAKAYPGIEFITTEENYKNISNFGMLWATKKYSEIYTNEIAARQKEYDAGTTRNGKPMTDKLKKYLERTLPVNRAELKQIQNMELVKPTTTFSKELTIRRGGRVIQLIYLGWGNTTGDGIVYLPKEKIMVSGDLVVYPSPFESDNFSTEWLATLKKLNNYEFNYLLPGHGPVLNDHKYLSFLVAFFEEIIKEVNDAVAKDKTLDETKLIVTNKSVTDAVAAAHPEYAEIIKNIESGFVDDALLRAYPKAHEAKLNE